MSCLGAAHAVSDISKANRTGREDDVRLRRGRRADYLLHRPGGFDLYSDHINLKFIFNPASLRAAVPKYTVAKLDQWAMLLMGYEYRIKDIAGDDNVWAELLSRWGRVHQGCAIFRVPLKISPLLGKEFVWPTALEVQSVQEAAVSCHQKRKKGLPSKSFWWSAII
jgi:hypothetical protein